MRIRDAEILVVDTETTGLDPKKDRLCEIGVCHVWWDKNGWQIGGDDWRLINPGIQVPATASAVHHLTNKDLVDAPPAATVVPAVLREYPADLLVAHNAEFDRGFLSPYADHYPWLCTRRLARLKIPDAPSHSNQVLRYHLGFADVPGDAHRAGHDARVAAMILCHMLYELPADATIEEIIALSEKPVFLTCEVGFGKHSDKTWSELPTDYLQWMQRQGADDWDRDQWFTIRQVLAGR